MQFVITGSGAGIGAGTALRAASYGAKIMLSDINDENGQSIVESFELRVGQPSTSTVMSPMRTK